MRLTKGPYHTEGELN